MTPEYYRPPAGTLLPFYHIATDDSPPHVRNLYAVPSVAKFTSDLEFLCRHYRPLEIAEVCELPVRREEKAYSPNAFLLSFDDGMREVYDIVFPVLRQKGIPAIVFVNSAMIDNKQLMWRHKISLILERCRQSPWRRFPQLNNGRCDRLEARLKALRWADESTIDEIARACDIDSEDYLRRQQPYLTSDQLLCMARAGIAIGAHSEKHPYLQDLGLMEQQQEIKGSTEFLRKLGLPCKFFSFPFDDNGISTSVFNYLSTIGISASFGSSEARIDEIPTSFQRFRADGSRVQRGMCNIVNRLSLKSLVLRISKAERIRRPHAA